jgi:hypothetical protein
MIIEYTADLPGGEPGWTVVPGTSSSSLNGVKTTTFNNPSAASGFIHFRVLETAP